MTFRTLQQLYCRGLALTAIVKNLIRVLLLFQSRYISVVGSFGSGIPKC